MIQEKDELIYKAISTQAGRKELAASMAQGIRARSTVRDFDSVGLMLLAMAEWLGSHPGCEVLPSDSPGSSIGYTSMNDANPISWKIDIGKVSGCADLVPYFDTADFRKRVVSWLRSEVGLSSVHSHVDSCPKCLPAYVINI